MPSVVSNKVNLIDMNFKQLSIEDKRAAFVLMDAMLKKLHEKDLMVADFNPSKIYYKDGYYSFDSISSISNYYGSNKDVVIFSNVLALCNLAFCSYLPDYQLNQGMLNLDVVCDNFDKFSSFLPEEDRKYYKEILVDSYSKGKVDGNSLYYSDYVIELGHNNNSNNSSLAYVKATEIGRAMANNDDESGFGHNLFLITMVFSLVIGMIGIILCFSNYIG